MRIELTLLTFLTVMGLVFKQMHFIEFFQVTCIKPDYKYTTYSDIKVTTGQPPYNDTVCFVNIDQGSKMNIFESILTSFRASVDLRVRWDNS